MVKSKVFVVRILSIIVRENKELALDIKYKDSEFVFFYDKN